MTKACNKNMPQHYSHSTAMRFEGDFGSEEMSLKRIDAHNLKVQKKQLLSKKGVLL